MDVPTQVSVWELEFSGVCLRCIASENQYLVQLIQDGSIEHVAVGPDPLELLRRTCQSQALKKAAEKLEEDSRYATWWSWIQACDGDPEKIQELNQKLSETVFPPPYPNIGKGVVLDDGHPKGGWPSMKVYRARTSW